MKERKNIDETHLEKEDGRHNQIRVRKSITQEEGINTLHVCWTQREPFSLICDWMLDYVNCFLWMIKSAKEKEMSLKMVFIKVLDKIAGLAPTYPQVHWRIQSDVVLGKTKDIVGVFLL